MPKFSLVSPRGVGADSSDRVRHLACMKVRGILIGADQMENSARQTSKSGETNSRAVEGGKEGPLRKSY